MLIAQLTDPHITNPGELVYDAIDTAENARRAIARLNNLNPKPDVVLITGDLVDRGDDGEYQHLEELLSELTLPCFMTIGNHDTRTTFLQRFGNTEHTGIKVVSSQSEFVQYVLDLGDWYAIAIDTHVAGQSYGSICSERLAWLEDALSKHGDKPTLLFMHHPPFETGIWWMDAIRLHGVKRLERIVRSNSQVRRIVCGHVHRPVHTMWAGVPCSIAPSTAHQVSLDLAGEAFMTMLTEPPAFHLHELSSAGAWLTHVCYVDEAADSFHPNNRMVSGMAAHLEKYRGLAEMARQKDLEGAEDEK